MVDKASREVEKVNNNGGEQPSSLLNEFWQSFKYTTVQSSYDGVSQFINHMGGNIKERHFADAPVERVYGSPEWIAQTAGGGLSKIAAIAILHKGISAAPGMAARPLGSLSMAGGLYEGLATKSGENFWQDRLANATAGSLTMYTMGRAHNGLQNVSGLAKYAPDAISGIIAKRLGSGATGFAAGGLSGFVGVETNSFLKDLKPASADNVGKEMLLSAFMGGAFGLAARPGYKSNESAPQRTGALPAEPAVHTHVGRPIPTNVEATGPQFSKLAGDGTIKAQTATKLSSQGLDEILRTVKLEGRQTAAPPAPVEPPAKTTSRPTGPDVPPDVIPGS